MEGRRVSRASLARMGGGRPGLEGLPSFIKRQKLECRGYTVGFEASELMGSVVFWCLACLCSFFRPGRAWTPDFSSLFCRLDASFAMGKVSQVRLHPEPEPRSSLAT